MIEELREVFERLRQQPEEVQRRIAEMVREELDEEEGEIVVTPELQAEIDASDAEFAAGDWVSLEELKRELHAREDH